MALVILGIHGLGNKPDKDTLQHWWALSMQEGLEKHGLKNQLPEFKMVYWADILYPKPFDIDVKEPESPYFIDEKYTKSVEDFQPKSYRFLKDIIRFLGKQLNKIFLNEDFTLKFSFIPDYIISKYFQDLDIYYKKNCEYEDTDDCRKKNLIKQRLADTLKRYKDDDIMLIAHSMGSIIAFDVLSFVTPETRIHTFITMGSPLGLPIVLSKIASQYKNTSPAGEKEMITPPGIYGNWFNYSDIQDKITMNYKLSKRYRFNKYAIKPRDFGVVNDYHNEQGKHNPHKSYGYLRTKEFARVLNNFLSQ